MSQVQQKRLHTGRETNVQSTFVQERPGGSAVDLIYPIFYNNYRNNGQMALTP